MASQVLPEQKAFGRARAGEAVDARALYRWEDDGGYVPAAKRNDKAPFDLQDIARALRAGQLYARDGLAARTLIRSPDLRVVVVALRSGKTIAEHHAGVTASLQTLSGHLSVELPDRRVDVPAGQLLVLDAGLSHDVSALSDSAFLLTLGWPAPSGA